jgi:hypothetical protein
MARWAFGGRGLIAVINRSHLGELVSTFLTVIVVVWHIR